MRNLSFQKGYLLAAFLLFFVEVLIALFVQDKILRPYGGDLLIIFFLYCLLKGFFRIPVKNAIFGVLFFAYAIEILQYLNLLQVLNIQQNLILNTVLGNYFDWKDILVYTLAGVVVFIVEKLIFKASIDNL